MSATRQRYAPWYGLIMMLNTETTDGRILVEDTDDPVSTLEMPLPVLAEAATAGADRMVGTVEWIGRHGNDVVAAGTVDMAALLEIDPPWSGGYSELADGGKLAVAVAIRDGQITVDLGGDTVRIRRPWSLRSVLILRSGVGAWSDAHLRLAVPLVRHAAPRRWV